MSVCLLPQNQTEPDPPSNGVMSDSDLTGDNVVSGLCRSARTRAVTKWQEDYVTYKQVQPCELRFIYSLLVYLRSSYLIFNLHSCVWTTD